MVNSFPSVGWELNDLANKTQTSCMCNQCKCYNEYWGSRNLKPSHVNVWESAEPKMWDSNGCNELEADKWISPLQLDSGDWETHQNQKKTLSISNHELSAAYSIS